MKQQNKTAFDDLTPSRHTHSVHHLTPGYARDFLLLSFQSQAMHPSDSQY